MSTKLGQKIKSSLRLITPYGKGQGSKSQKNFGVTSKKSQSGVANEDFTMAFSKIQEAIRDHMNMKVNIDYIKVFSVGLDEMCTDLKEELQRKN